MRRRPNQFANLVYDGDWHSKLVSVLKLAKEGSRSQEIHRAIATLEQLLSESDECLHTVTATQPVPRGIAPDFAMECVEECIDVTPGELKLSIHGELALTITARGDREHVVGMAMSILKCGVNHAKAAIWAAGLV